MHVKPCCRDGYLRVPRAPRLHWLIAGGDTAPDARPVNPDWLRRLRVQCDEEQIGFYFTGWGTWVLSRGFSLGRKIRVPDSSAKGYILMQRAGNKPETPSLDGWLHQDIPSRYAADTAEKKLT